MKYTYIADLQSNVIPPVVQRILSENRDAYPSDRYSDATFLEWWEGLAMDTRSGAVSLESPSTFTLPGTTEVCSLQDGEPVEPTEPSAE